MSSRRITIAVMLAAMLAGQTAPAANRPHSQRAASPLSVHDVRLDAEGHLNGAVVDVQGRPQAGVAVTLQAAGRDPVRVTTDARGVFRAPVAAGVYRLQCLGGERTCRLWTHQAAPPQAQNAILAVAAGSVQLGQCNNCGHCAACQGGGWFGGRAQAWLIGGALLGAAIVIPLIDDPDGS